MPLERARERTTSPLQMGHVRRRVVSQGVLQSQLVSIRRGQNTGVRNLHALRVEFVTTRETHHPAHAVDVFLQTDDTLSLLAAVSPTPFRQTSCAFLFDLIKRWTSHRVRS